MANEWHSRGYIPHWEQGIAPQTITFRLADSLPSSLLEQWRGELEKMPDNERMLERRRRIQIALDLGRGESWLANAVIANIVENALLHFDGQRYRLHAWVIMPNHVHVLATLLEGSTLSAVMHSLKSFTASKSNKHLRRGGLFWAPEYFDRAIRDQAHYSSASRTLQ